MQPPFVAQQPRKPITLAPHPHLIHLSFVLAYLTELAVKQ